MESTAPRAGGGGARRGHRPAPGTGAAGRAPADPVGVRTRRRPGTSDGAKAASIAPRAARIAAELKRIQARCAGDVAVQMTPLIEAFEANGRDRPSAGTPAQLAAMAGSLAQRAVQAGDVAAAVAIASLQAEIDAIPSTELRPARPTVAAQAVGTLTLARRHLLALVFGLLGAGAISYAVYVGAQVRFPPGSVLAWLLSASTTLLAVALVLRVGASLALRIAPRRLTAISAGVAAVACIVAVGTALRYRPVLEGSGRDLPTPAIGTPLPALVDGPASAVPPGAPGAPGALIGVELPAAATVPPTISLWWLGDEVAARPAATRVPAAGQLAAAPDSNVPPSAAPIRPRPRIAPTPPARAEPVLRYADLLNRQVLLIDADGETHRGILTGIGKDGVTLDTELMMFGQPIKAERRFPSAAIGHLDAE